MTQPRHMPLVPSLRCLLPDVFAAGNIETADLNQQINIYCLSNKTLAVELRPDKFFTRKVFWGLHGGWRAAILSFLCKPFNGWNVRSAALRKKEVERKGRRRGKVRTRQAASQQKNEMNENNDSLKPRGAVFTWTLESYFIVQGRPRNAAHTNTHNFSYTRIYF